MRPMASIPARMERTVIVAMRPARLGGAHSEEGAALEVTQAVEIGTVPLYNMTVAG